MSDQDEPKDPKVVQIGEAKQRLRHAFYGVVENVGTNFVNDAKDIVVTVSFAAGLVDESYYVDRTLLFKDGKEMLLNKGTVINFNVASGFEKWTVPNDVGEPADTGMGFQRITAIRLVNNS